MDKQRIYGVGRQLKGAAKAGLGRLIGDAKLVADGDAEQASGRAQAGNGDFAASTIGVDKDRIKGVGHQLRGAAKLGVGKLLGDAKLQAEGSAERLLGRAQDVIGSARDQARDALKNKDEPGKP